MISWKMIIAPFLNLCFGECLFGRDVGDKGGFKFEPSPLLSGNSLTIAPLSSV